MRAAGAKAGCCTYFGVPRQVRHRLDRAFASVVRGSQGEGGFERLPGLALQPFHFSLREHAEPMGRVHTCRPTVQWTVAEGHCRAQILEKERPDAVLPTMGGQTGLNIAKELSESGVLDKYGIELIGAKLPSIDRAEDRDLFKKARCLCARNARAGGGMAVACRVQAPHSSSPSVFVRTTGRAAERSCVDELQARMRMPFWKPLASCSTFLGLPVSCRYRVPLLRAVRCRPIVSWATAVAMRAQAMDKLGLKMAVSKTANTLEEARDIALNIIGGFPIIIRPAYTLGGTGGGIAYNQDEFERIVTGGLDASMTGQARAAIRSFASGVIRNLAGP